ncbi:MAG: hypothetical protein ACFBSE_19655 [Prochloraceae cyanobacterium]
MKPSKISILLGIMAIASLLTTEVRSHEKITKESSLEIAQRRDIRQETAPLIDRQLYFLATQKYPARNSLLTADTSLFANHLMG